MALCYFTLNVAWMDMCDDVFDSLEGNFSIFYPSASRRVPPFLAPDIKPDIVNTRSAHVKNII
jgi:hypothetical protein